MTRLRYGIARDLNRPNSVQAVLIVIGMGEIGCEMSKNILDLCLWQQSHHHLFMPNIRVRGITFSDNLCTVMMDRQKVGPISLVM